MKTVSRSAGRSATAAAAYRAAEEIVDERTGEIHDYRRKAGVESADVILPDDVPSISRSELWNGIETHHKRRDAVVAREFVVALPAELDATQRRQLAKSFARQLANRYSVAADVCIHAPSKEGDERNHHAHILLSACSVSKAGFGKKVAELDPIHCQRHKVPNPADEWRERWADLANERLRSNGHAARIDHRSLKDQGADRAPSIHLGPQASSMERRGKQTERGDRVRKVLAAETEIALAQKELERIGSEIAQERKRTEPGKKQPGVNELLPLDRLPMEQQKRVFDLAHEKLTAARKEKAERIAVKALERHKRRENAKETISQAAPVAPKGMFAGLKKKAYEEALFAWSKAFERAKKLQEQANALYKKLLDAAQYHRAFSWSYQRIKEKNPQLVARLEARERVQSEMKPEAPKVRKEQDRDR